MSVYETFSPGRVGRCYDVDGAENLFRKYKIQKYTQNIRLTILLHRLDKPMKCDDRRNTAPVFMNNRRNFIKSKMKYNYHTDICYHTVNRSDRIVVTKASTIFQCARNYPVS